MADPAITEAVMEVLNDPMNLPSTFWDYSIMKWLLDAPVLPISQVFGFRQNSMTLLGEIDLSVTQEFSRAAGQIPLAASAFRHLRCEMIVRGTTVANETAVQVAVNNDGASVYFWQELATQAGGTFPQDSGGLVAIARTGRMAAASAVASSFTRIVLEIPYYSVSNAHKQGLYQSADLFANVSPGMTIETGAWVYESTSPIQSLVFSAGAGAFASGSLATLYGIG